MIVKIVSGGQTGVDRAALDIAIELNIPHGGWCPKERWAEDGPLAIEYQLTETNSVEPSERTKLNIRDSDGTLILIKSYPAGEGTQLTIDEAQHTNKPLLIIDLSAPHDPIDIAEWIKHNNIQILNIAGPRASQQVGIYDDAFQLLRQALLLGLQENALFKSTFS